MLTKLLKKPKKQTQTTDNYLPKNFENSLKLLVSNLATFGVTNIEMDPSQHESPPKYETRLLQVYVSGQILIFNCHLDFRKKTMKIEPAESALKNFEIIKSASPSSDQITLEPLIKHIEAWLHHVQVFSYPCGFYINLLRDSFFVGLSDCNFIDPNKYFGVQVATKLDSPIKENMYPLPDDLCQKVFQVSLDELKRISKECLIMMNK